VWGGVGEIRSTKSAPEAKVPAGVRVVGNDSLHHASDDEPAHRVGTRKIRGAPVLRRTSLASLNKSAAADSSENFWGLLPNVDADTS